jgi:hypothetical protein
MARGSLHSIAVADWPPDLMRGWRSALCPDGLLRKGGKAAQWADATKKHVSLSVGYYLAWLNGEGLTAASAAFTGLVTEAHVLAYAEVRRLDLRDASVRSNLVGLYRGMAVMFPERDWSWMRPIINTIPDGRAESRRHKLPRIRHSNELRQLGVDLCKEADGSTEARLLLRAVLFRDGVMIALLAERPIRRKNLTRLEIGVHVRKTPAGWRLFLPKGQVKNKQEYDHAIPDDIGALIERYIDVYRPVLLAARTLAEPLDKPYLWISARGTRLAPNSCLYAVRSRTQAAFGRSLSLHLFRDCAVSTAAMDMPKQVRAAMHVLGNRSFAVTEEAYNMATGSHAAGKLHDVFDEFRHDGNNDQRSMAGARRRVRS